MFSPFSCTTFNHQEEDDDEPMTTKTQLTSLPRKSSQSKISGLYKRHSKERKNPYSSVGLDKYSAIAADLEDKRQKIYAQTDDIAFVRFVFKDAIDTKVPVPIVVKLKDKKEDKTTKASFDNQEEKKHVTHKSEFLGTSTIEQCSSKVSKEVEQPKSECEKQRKKRGVSFWNMKAEEWTQPSYYLPAVMIFILLALAFFGRSFAILCTSILWYAIPTLKEGSNSTTTRKGPKKKVYVRSSSGNKMVAVGSSQQHRQKKSSR